MSEANIRTELIHWIKEQGGDAFAVHGGMLQRRGEPDICGELPYGGKWAHLKLEVKTEIGTPSPLQVKRVQQYLQRGYCSGIIRNVGEMQALLSWWDWWQRACPLDDLKSLRKRLGKDIIP